MQYYKNSMRYVKLLLFFVIFMAATTIFAPNLLGSMVNQQKNLQLLEEQLSAQENGQINPEAVQQIMNQGNPQIGNQENMQMENPQDLQRMNQENMQRMNQRNLQENNVREETEDEFVNRLFREYKQGNPNSSPEKDIEMQDILRNEYRAKHHMEPIPVRYAGQRPENPQPQVNRNNDIQQNTNQSRRSREIDDVGYEIPREQLELIREETSSK